MVIIPPKQSDTDKIDEPQEEHSQELTQRVKLFLQDGTEVNCLQMPDGTLILDDETSANETATTEELVEETTLQDIPVASEETIGPDEPDEQNDQQTLTQTPDDIRKDEPTGDNDNISQQTTNNNNEIIEKT